MKPIVIIAAVPREIALLEQALTTSVRVRSPLGTCCEGKLGRLPVVICAGGVGKVNAAAVTAALIERHHPKLVINTGCAGAYIESNLTVGELAVASEEILGDEGVLTAEGWQDLGFMKLPSLTCGSRHYHNGIPLSTHAAGKAVQLADCYGVRLTRGKFITVSTCSGTRRRGDELAARFHGICENMEGAAVAQVCLRCGIDCLEIRGISNLVEDRDMATWNIPLAVEAAQRFVLKFLEEMDRPELLKSGNLPVPDMDSL